ncbi:Linker histone H1 and H5 family protein [Monocercomonoides exilis]|uniref:Linker histone H1 and H5 family protein n=1 Tax=Monocercomonoides exilis TaxID=2049356 RepID=UPI00355A239D|nr:Linker histone H1 and H5 family protein [Monocercomonoides exilis]|eukprot:MONOS_2829.1-p1 / transcript=MONOS_2829.1 / gene=MONOS_2829 / organism=Monocercomonoides_exilis_PA203 / gene_product=Linker histone H1 and H5 family protein / transcript_product=Linker histone H1 and H5 family protein / location=Mono_scaffold00061:25652-26155(+) / protein_length=168 / sequence_SO=supercontig / SO=protein_coding / is_pseudo=false
MTGKEKSSKSVPVRKYIIEAIAALKERTGSSNVAIGNQILKEHEDIEVVFLANQLKIQLRQMVAAGILKKHKMSYLLTEKGKIALKPKAKKAKKTVKKAKGEKKPKKQSKKAKKETKKTKSSGQKSKKAKSSKKSSKPKANKKKATKSKPKAKKAKDTKKKSSTKKH